MLGDLNERAISLEEVREAVNEMRSGEARGPGAGCTKVLAVTVAKGERIHHDGCSRK